jgi:polysaccharide export outer membrane protein
MMVSRRLIRLLLTTLVAGYTSGVCAQNPLPAMPRAAVPRAASSSTPAAAAASADPAGTQAANTAPGTNITAAGGDYVLSPSDTVEMLVFHEPDLTTQTKIGSDGMAQFPLIGELKIAGLAMRDARELIRRRYNADYLVEPQVYLNVVGYAARKFTILGQVARPGTYDFPPGEHLNLLEAVGLAGGFTRLADRSAVVVKRDVGGSEQTLKVNAKKLTLKDGKPFALDSGDVVTVGESWF